MGGLPASACRGSSGHGRVEALRRVPLFAELGDDDLQCVADAANDVEVPAGQLLVQPGTAGSGMFFIAEGTAVVETKRDESRARPRPSSSASSR